MPPLTWSYSTLTMFKQCQHKYYRMRVLKDIWQEETTAMRYGNEVHKAAELYMKGTKELSTSYEFLRPYLLKLAALPGDKHCELKLGLTEELEPCGFFDPHVWFRGVVDLIIVNGSKARVVDYKTGKSARYADKDQLELMSLAAFKHFPELKQIQAGLLFVVCNAFVREEYHKKDEGRAWSEWVKEVNKIERAMENNVWNKTPNFTCYGCPVTDCEHYQTPKFGRN